MKARIPLPFLVVVLLLVLGVGIGCNKAQTKAKDDSQITSEIQGKFAQDSGLSNKNLGVQTAGGVVTISGTVDNQAERDAAARQAATIE